MKRKVKRRMIHIIIGVLFIIIGTLIVWFNISYSPLKKQFTRDIERLTAGNILDTNGEVFTAEDFDHLPEPIQKYIKNTGYIGKKKMSYLKMEYKDVDFSTGKNGAKMKMDYTQYNFAGEPCRMAFDDASMFGVPFQGYDYYENGKGGMKGVIAKLITLFNETGSEMDRSCLVTFLAESLFLPSALMQDYITFEQISEYQVKGTITFREQTVSGIFTFNDRYEMVSFVTTDRKDDKTPWTAICSDYSLSENGLRLPQKFRAVWNYTDGDFVYFDGIINEITYG